MLLKPFIWFLYVRNRKKYGIRNIPFYDVFWGQLTLLAEFWMLKMSENMKIAVFHFIVLLGANYQFQRNVLWPAVFLTYKASGNSCFHFFLYINIFGYLLPVCNERKACWLCSLNSITYMSILSSKEYKKYISKISCFISISLTICYPFVMKNKLVDLICLIVSLICVF